jgi:hypothetical protein
MATGSSAAARLRRASSLPAAGMSRAPRPPRPRAEPAPALRGSAVRSGPPRSAGSATAAMRPPVRPRAAPAARAGRPRAVRPRAARDACGVPWARPAGAVAPAWPGAATAASTPAAPAAGTAAPATRGQAAEAGRVERAGPPAVHGPDGRAGPAGPAGPAAQAGRAPPRADRAVAAERESGCRRRGARPSRTTAARNCHGAALGGAGSLGQGPSSAVRVRPGAAPDARSASMACCRMITAAA